MMPVQDEMRDKKMLRTIHFVPVMTKIIQVDPSSSRM
jgi:hypothetical protein